MRALAFSADGKWLALADGSQAVRLWDVGASQELQSLTFPGPLDSVAVSPDTKYMAVASAGGTYAALLQPKGRAVTLPASEARQLACSQAREAQLTQDEWKKYFGLEPLWFTCGPPRVEVEDRRRP